MDVFRGMTIAGMVLVNNPGSWAHIYSPLEHAEWHGLTPTDWIFPFFLFIVGVAIAISLGRTIENGITGKVYRKIVSRSVSIYLLGAAISVVPFFQFSTSDAPDPLKLLVWIAFAAALFFLLLRNYRVAGILAALGFLGIGAFNLAGYNIIGYDYGHLRIFGVLQRIAVCYLIVSLIFLHTGWKQQLGISVILLLGYWLVMTVIPVPGCEITSIDDKACNVAAWLDRTILSENHIWRAGKVFDPEGILSTIPAIVTTLSGVLTGTWLAARNKILATSDDDPLTAPAENAVLLVPNRSELNRVSGIFFFGTILLAVGYIWSSYFPLNKSLWTSSYVLVTTGLALLTLGCCYWLIDIKGYRKWTKPFVIFGVNALPLFVFSGIFARMITSYRVTNADGTATTIQGWVFANIYLAIAQPIDASLLYAISFILLWLFLMWLLYRKQIFMKV